MTIIERASHRIATPASACSLSSRTSLLRLCLCLWPAHHRQPRPHRRPLLGPSTHPRPSSSSPRLRHATDGDPLRTSAPPRLGLPRWGFWREVRRADAARAIIRHALWTPAPRANSHRPRPLLNSILETWYVLNSARSASLACCGVAYCHSASFGQRASAGALSD